MEACLRDHIMSIQSEDCTKQVVRLITEAHGDVHLDPLLMRACQKDIGYLCGRVLPGKGQIIECLQVIFIIVFTFNLLNCIHIAPVTQDLLYALACLSSCDLLKCQRHEQAVLNSPSVS